MLKEKTPCALCGNDCAHEMCPCGGSVICPRCAGVIRDRAKNAISHDPLIPNRAVWYA